MQSDCLIQLFLTESSHAPSVLMFLSRSCERVLHKDGTKKRKKMKMVEKKNKFTQDKKVKCKKRKQERQKYNSLVEEEIRSILTELSIHRGPVIHLFIHSFINSFIAS